MSALIGQQKVNIHRYLFLAFMRDGTRFFLIRDIFHYIGAYLKLKFSKSIHILGKC